MKPDALVLHSLTNDVRNISLEECISSMEEIINTVEKKWSGTKTIISLATPRLDSQHLNNKVNMLNATISDKFYKHKSVTISDNSNMFNRGIPSKQFLDMSDGYHLSDSGTRMLASNIRIAVDSALGIPRYTPRVDNSRHIPNTYQGRGQYRGPRQTYQSDRTSNYRQSNSWSPGNASISRVDSHAHSANWLGD